MYTLPHFAAHNLFYPLHLAIFTVAAYYSPQNIMSTHPLRVIYAFSFNYAVFIHRMMYTHITQEKFNPFRRTVVLTWGILLAQTFNSIAFGDSLMDEPTLYLILACAGFGAMCHLIIFVI